MTLNAALCLLCRLRFRIDRARLLNAVEFRDLVQIRIEPALNSPFDAAIVAGIQILSETVDRQSRFFLR